MRLDLRLKTFTLKKNKGYNKILLILWIVFIIIGYTVLLMTNTEIH